ncbi:hypothetical protein, partial [Pseudomonas sp. AF1]|uniref:hypothetical protein n=1 Tax=Pseudomonas sp. AF1 TaxID=2806610 RepID=UPI001EEE1F73
MSENNTPSPANGTPAPAAARTRSALWPVLGIVAALAAGGVLAWQMGWLERLREEARRVRKECRIWCSSKWSPYH